MSRASMLLLTAFVVLSSASAFKAPGVHAALTAKKSRQSPEVVPPIEHVAGDKEFFGPPFPADYPNDHNPPASQELLRKAEGEPYPHLQTANKFDYDFVKDSNTDNGEWKAQDAYDKARTKVSREASEAAMAKAQAEAEGRKLTAAEQAAYEAAQAAAEAERDAIEKEKAAAAAKEAADHAAKVRQQRAEEEARRAAEAGMTEEEILKHRLKIAEDNYAKEKKDFEECKKELDKSWADLEQARANYNNFKKNNATHMIIMPSAAWDTAEISKVKDAETRMKAAEAKLKAVRLQNDRTQGALAKEKVEAARLQKIADKEATDEEKANEALMKAVEKLRSVRGLPPLEKAAAAAITAVATQNVHQQSGTSSVGPSAALAAMLFAVFAAL